jgi:glycosyltransferase involved in cell wall biosynthesis
VEISAVVITFNEEKRLEAALRSLEGVASEIIVVDSLSTDDTLKVARKYTERVYERAWTHSADQKNHADTLASFPWILSLDADERLSPALRDELVKLRGHEPPCTGFSIPREAYYLGRWIRHSGWRPDRRVRLFRRDRARWEGDDVHERLVVDGDVEKLRGPIHHFPFETIGEHAARVNKFSSLAAQKLYAGKKKARLLRLLVLPTLRCLKTYFLKLGLLDGFPGLVIACLDGYGEFLRSAKLRSIWKKGKHIEPFPY